MEVTRRHGGRAPPSEGVVDDYGGTAIGLRCVWKMIVEATVPLLL